VVLEEKRREIIKEWIGSGRIKYNNNASNDKKVFFIRKERNIQRGYSEGVVILKKEKIKK
jgi:hypothetical protein